LAVLGLSLCLVLSAFAADKEALPTGTYRLAYLATPGGESTQALIKVETKDGKITGSLAAKPPRYDDLMLNKFTVEGSKVHAVVKLFGNEYAFDGLISAKDGKTVLGTYAVGGRVYPARLTATDLTEVTAKDAFTPLKIEQVQKIQQLESKVTQLRF